VDCAGCGPCPCGGSKLNGMTWTWRLEDADGNPVDVGGLARVEFPSQGDAESWIGETWRELRAAGVDQVTLLEAGREVYGPMSLHPADESAD
jgi:hypothetical protein